MGIKKPYHHIRLTQEAKKDLKVWSDFLENYNGKSLFLEEMFLSPRTLHLYTDAAKGLGFAAVYGSHWFFGKWNPWWSIQNITLRELVPIVLALEASGHLFRDVVIVLHTDNLALVSVIKKQTSKEKYVMALTRRLVTASLQYNTMFQAEHIPGKQNDLADSLSRLQVEKFKRLHPQADPLPSPFPSLPETLV